MKTFIVTLVAGVVVLAAVAIAQMRDNSAPEAAAGAPVQREALMIQLRALQEKPLEIHPFDRVMGSMAAPVTIIEYASMTCSHCADFHRTVIPEIQRDWVDTGKAKYVLRDLPWDNMAFAMAKVARCVEKPRYYDAVKDMMANQTAILTAGDVEAIVAAMAGVMEPYGMSTGDVKACINGSQEDHWVIEAMKDSAVKVLGVKGTPATFIDGTLVDGARDYRDVKAVLAKAYEAKAGR